MQNNIRAITGNWNSGFALDKHTISSVFLGYDENGHPRFDTKRSEIGEALYQLKYRHDFSKAEPLAIEIAEHLVPRFAPIGLIIPMPATIERARQPVNAVAQALAQRLAVPIFENVLVKNPPEPGAPQLKDLTDKAAKVAALQGRFRINPAIQNEGQWNALLVDDLFDTGASMEAAVNKLREYPKIDNIFVAALTWK